MNFSRCLLALSIGLPSLLAADVRIIAGTVTTLDGNAVGGARILVRNARGTEAMSAFTNASGRFVLSGFVPGRFTISVESLGLESARVEIRLVPGLSGVEAEFHLAAAPGMCARRDCATVRGLRPSEVLRFDLGEPSRLGSEPLTQAEEPHIGTNTPAVFTIQTSVAAPSPPSFGFNFAPSSYSANNIFTDGGGMGPFDARFSLNATDPGTANTFIDNDCAAGCEGTDIYQSIASGYFTGANARVYHFDPGSNAWSLINSGQVTGYTAVSSSDATADHTITLNTSGMPSQPGDAIWLSLDAVPAIPNYLLLDSRLQAYGFYGTVWTFETGSTLNYLSPMQVNLQNPTPFSYDTDAPPGDSFSEPGALQPLSLKLTDQKHEVAGAYQYLLGTDLGPGQSESLQPGRTYQITLWLKQTGIANGSVTFSTEGSHVYARHTFTGVTGNWQLFTWQFPGFLAPPLGSVAPSLHLDFQAPGTLWIDQVQINDITSPPFTIDSRVMSAWSNYAPATMRIWTNFGNSGGGYSFWSLDSWLANDSEDRIDPGIGNIYEEHVLHAHLPTSLNIAQSVGADPWLIVNMSLSETEWGNLIDYLTAPVGVGYAQKRPATHPNPYTDDFSTIYLEFGNEEWGTQETAVNQYYGPWVHYMLRQAIAGKSYFDPNKVKFVVNGFTLSPGFGSAAIAAAPEASVVDFFSYNGGDTTLTGDAYYQSDLFSLVRLDQTLGASVQSLINNLVAQQKQDAANGVNYSLAVYEGGPGADTANHLGDPSLAAAVGNLDVFLYASLQGVQQQNFFLFNFGTGPFTSHTYLYQGFYPHPAWEALQMRNQYCHGDIVSTLTNQVPVSHDGNAFPLISIYAFHEVNPSGVDQADIVVISRDLKNQTPVTLQMPAAPTGGATIYTLTGNPRANNDTKLSIPIGTMNVPIISQNYQFTMPPGSVYLLQVPLSSWPVQPATAK